jgi:hypothetical protein
MPASPSAQAAALRMVLGPSVPTSSSGPPGWTGGGPTGRTDSTTFSPAQTLLITATRSAMPAIVFVAGSAPAAR